MEAEHDWYAHCEVSEAILKAVRSGQQSEISAAQMAHLHDDRLNPPYTADGLPR